MNYFFYLDPNFCIALLLLIYPQWQLSKDLKVLGKLQNKVDGTDTQIIFKPSIFNGTIQ